jgi:hypothetical protein
MNTRRFNHNIRQNSALRECGKSGMLQHNKDRMGSNSGPMGTEDQRKDKYGSVHNQDHLGLLSDATAQKREELGRQRLRMRRRKNRRGSR